MKRKSISGTRAKAGKKSFARRPSPSHLTCIGYAILLDST